MVLFSVIGTHHVWAESEVLPEDWQQIIETAPMTKEEFSKTTFSSWIFSGVRMIQQQIQQPIVFLFRMMAVLFLCAMVRSLMGDKIQSAGMLVELIAALSIFMLCATQMTNLMTELTQAINTAKTYLISFIPIFSSVLIASGQATTATVYAGIFFTGANFIAGMLAAVGLPIVQMCMSFAATGCVCNLIDLNRIAKLSCSAVQWILGIAAAGFTSLMTMQSVFAQSADSFALKTGKFLLGSSIPVVGGAVSNAMGGVLSGMRVIKGSIGFAAIAVILMIFVPILIKVFLYRIVFTVAEIVSGGLGNKKSGQLLHSMIQCTGVCISMAALFAFLMSASTILMILLGSGEL